MTNEDSSLGKKFILLLQIKKPYGVDYKKYLATAIEPFLIICYFLKI